MKNTEAPDQSSKSVGCAWYLKLLFGFFLGFGIVQILAKLLKPPIVSDNTFLVIAFGVMIVMLAASWFVLSSIFSQKNIQHNFQRRELEKQLKFRSDRYGEIDKEIDQLKQSNPMIGFVDAMAPKSTFVGMDPSTVLQPIEDLRYQKSIEMQKEIEMKVAAAANLGEMGDPRAGKALMAALKDPVAPVRASAVEALGKIGLKAALPKLAEIAQYDMEEKVRKAASNAMKMIEKG